MTGDWVAVRVHHALPHKAKSQQGNSCKTTGTGKHPVKAVMHIARIDDIDNDSADALYKVSFLKRNSDSAASTACYVWPDVEDTSYVDRTDIVSVEEPSENIVSRGSTIRITLNFSRKSLEYARKILNIAPGNVR